MGEIDHGGAQGPVRAGTDAGNQLVHHRPCVQFLVRRVVHDDLSRQYGNGLVLGSGLDRVERSIMSIERLQALGRELRALRTDAGWSGSELASLAGVTQPTVSRVENGQRVSSPDALGKIIDALPVAAGGAERLRSKARDVYAATAERRADAGYSFVADTVRRLERDARSVRGFQSAVIPRLLRTAEYAHAAGAGDPSGADLLGDAGRHLHFVVTEGALRTWPGSGDVMPAQLDHLLSAAELPNVRLGLVPWSHGLAMAPPHGFTLYDDNAASLETFTTEIAITDPADVSAYADAFAALERSALYGDDARALLDTVRRDFAELGIDIQ